MTAEEMFENIGYKNILKNHYKFIFMNEKIYNLNNQPARKIISFDLICETIVCKLFNGVETGVGDLSIDEIKVINKQIEELGW